jgi:kinesin family protein 2/24
MHADSKNLSWAVPVKKVKDDNDEASPGEIMGTSRDPNPRAAKIPFKQRLRPGMVVKCKPHMLSSYQDMAIILCPAGALPSASKDSQGKGAREEQEDKYLCAMVYPGILPGSHQVSLWHQMVVDVDWMEKEVLLEYDAATRYYFAMVS